MVSRRKLLFLLAGAPLAVATREVTTHAARQLPHANLAEGGVRLALPNLASDGFYPEVRLSTTSVYQGGTLEIRVDRAVSGVAYVFGRSYLLTPDGEGGAIGLVGFGTGDPPGPALLSFDVEERPEEYYSTSTQIQVLKTDWTVDHIWIPPAPPPDDDDEDDPDAPPPPPPPPDDNLLLPGIYSGVTARKWTPGWVAPLPEPLDVTGYFGEQRSFNGGPVQGHHGGTDFGANFGTPIYSTNHGVVVMSGLYLVRGNIVVVDHGAGVFSLYGHMQERAVSVGDVVSRGQVLGYVGSTGLSTGAHLHWELSVAGVLVDGLRWLDGSQGF